MYSWCPFEEWYDDHLFHLIFSCKDASCFILLLLFLLLLNTINYNRFVSFIALVTDTSTLFSRVIAFSSFPGTERKKNKSSCKTAHEVVRFTLSSPKIKLIMIRSESRRWVCLTHLCFLSVSLLLLLLLSFFSFVWSEFHTEFSGICGCRELCPVFLFSRKLTVSNAFCVFESLKAEEVYKQVVGFHWSLWLHFSLLAVKEITRREFVSKHDGWQNIWSMITLLTLSRILPPQARHSFIIGFSFCTVEKRSKTRRGRKG